MKLSDIIDGLANSDANPLNKTTSKVVMNAVIDMIADALKGGDKVELPGLGKLEVKERAARNGRNPATGESIAIAASKTVKFNVAKAVKDAL